METQRQDLMNSIGLLILRLGICGYMVTHGWSKLKMVLAGDFDKFGDPIGLGIGLSLVLVTGAEFLCPLLVLAGLATRFAAVPVVIAMGVAAFVAHGADPWTMERGAMLFMAGESQSWASKQPALMFLTVFLALAFTGPGRFSVDEMIRSRVRHAGQGAQGSAAHR